MGTLAWFGLEEILSNGDVGCGRLSERELCSGVVEGGDTRQLIARKGNEKSLESVQDDASLSIVGLEFIADLWIKIVENLLARSLHLSVDLRGIARFKISKRGVNLLGGGTSLQNRSNIFLKIQAVLDLPEYFV